MKRIVRLLSITAFLATLSPYSEASAASIFVADLGPVGTALIGSPATDAYTTQTLYPDTAQVDEVRVIFSNDKHIHALADTHNHVVVAIENLGVHHTASFTYGLLGLDGARLGVTSFNDTVTNQIIATGLFSTNASFGATVDIGGFFLDFVNPLPIQTGITGFRFSLDNNFTYENSDGLPLFSVETVNPVPVPAALPLFFSGLLALGILGRRRKRANSFA